MSPDARRQSLVQATRRAIAELGTVPTTRQIADAAGVAEGTIFRVFPTKEALLEAVTADLFDPAPLFAALSGIDSGLPLRERLYELVAILQRRFTEIFEVMSALGLVAPPPDAHRGPPKDAALLPAFVAVIGDDAASLTVPAEEAIRVIRLLTFSGSHPRITHGHVLTPERIVDVLLDGLLG